MKKVLVTTTAAITTVGPGREDGAPSTRRWIVAVAVAVLFLHAERARAQCTVTPYIVVDGNTCDWTSAQQPLTIPDNNYVPPGGLDLLQTQLTDSYSTGSTGNGDLYGLMTFANGTNFQVNSQVGLFLNIAGGPTPAPACNANYALSFTCINSPCTNSANWDTHLYGALGGSVCESAQTGTALSMTGSNQQASFAINGATIEFGVTFASLGLPTTFLATPYSTPDQNTNASLETLTQVSYSATNVGPTAVTVSRLAAKAGNQGVTLGWITQSERGNLGFWLWRSRDNSPWVKVNSDLIGGAMNAFAPVSYRYRDPQGRVGDLYLLSDIDRRTAVAHHVGPVAASSSAELPERHLQPRRARSVWAPASPGPVARLGVTREGMYRVRQADLQAAGVQIRGDAELGFWGEPVTFVRSGSDLIFYAGPVRNAYDGVDAYLLKAGRHGAPQPSPRPRNAGFVNMVESHLLLKNDRAYNWYQDGDDPYIWAWSSNLFPVDPVSFDAPAAAPGGGGRIRLQLVGGTAFGHHVQVQLNGASLGEASWVGNGSQPFFANLPAALLLPSGNSLAVVPVFDTGAPYEFVMLDSIDLTYDRAPVAVNGEARFSLNPDRCAQVSGLGAGSDAWDVTDTLNTVPGVGSPVGDRVVVCSPHDGHAHIFELFDATALLQPTVRPAAASRLKDVNNRADELVIVHPSLVSSVEPLVRARTTQGLAVYVATLAEVYDAFGYGNEGREPIRRFLHYAHTRWRVPPRYILLVGGANADVRDVMATGVPNLIPSGVVVAGPEAMRAASDGWFVTGRDGLTPEAAIGRLAVDSPAEAATVIGKILSADGQGPATRTAVLAADVMFRPDDADFGQESAVVANHLSSAGVSPIAVSAGAPAPGQVLAATLDLGVDLWHYVGHAGTSAWGSHEWFRASDVAALRNKRLPILASFDCLDGMFDNPTTVSMGWAAVENVSGGALVSFVPSTVLSPREAHAFDLLVIKGLASPQAARIGDALLWAQRQAAAQPALHDFVRTYNLLGDPASPSPLH